MQGNEVAAYAATGALGLFTLIKGLSHIIRQWYGDRKEDKADKSVGNQIELLEKEMDLMNNDLPELRNFILPGGSQAASFCHVARTVCRRAERKIVELSEKAEVDPNLIKFVNRLSDYLFVLSRKINLDQKTPEILWSPEVDE